MNRIRLTHILLCAFVVLGLVTSFTAQDRDAPPPLLSPYQKWLDEDAVYIITDEERADFAKLQTDQQRDKFVEDFWQRRNPDPQSGANPFKEEHYRRLAYANQNFAASTPGWKTDRGRIYIVYGPPDEREQHPASLSGTLPADAPPTERYPTDIWRYNFIQGIGRNVFFDFVDECDCGKFQLIHDPSKRRPDTPKLEQTTTAGKTRLAIQELVDRGGGPAHPRQERTEQESNRVPN